MNRKKILVVDDTKSNIDMLLNLLSNDYDVFVAMNGEKAIKMVQKRDIDLILLDIVMPEIDGYEVCRQIKRDETKRDIPVLFLTAKTDEDSIEKAFDVGGVDYAIKPFRPKELLSRVKTHLKLSETLKKLQYLAFRDPMTGVYNRRRFFEIFEKLVQKYENISVAMIDIDKFKSINDNYGHAFGDKVIKSLTSTVSNILPEKSLFGRLGGEEFAVVLGDIDQSLTLEIAEKLRETISNLELKFETKIVKFTISIGVSQYKKGESVDKALHRADTALYTAKNSGRNRVVRSRD